MSAQTSGEIAVSPRANPSWMPAPTTPLRRCARLAIGFGPFVIATALQLPICIWAIVLREPCPGCGMTRAGRALAHLDIDTALALNPLALAVLPAASWLIAESVVLYVLRGRTKLGEPLRRNIGLGICLSLIIVWALRRYFGAFGGPVSL